MSLGLTATSRKQHEADLRNPALCEQLRVRDILDNVVVTTSGAFVASYELAGLHSHYDHDDARNRAKESLEAVLRSMPERSMRLHMRFEIREDAGGVLQRYLTLSQTNSVVLAAIDEER